LLDDMDLTCRNKKGLRLMELGLARAELAARADTAGPISMA